MIIPLDTIHRHNITYIDESDLIVVIGGSRQVNTMMHMERIKEKEDEILKEHNLKTKLSATA
jgi:hypothetical protein